MPISKAKALELLERHIALLHEKRRTARDSTRSSYAYDDFHGVYHCAVVLLARLFDAHDAEAFRRQLTLPSLSRGGMPERDRQFGDNSPSLKGRGFYGLAPMLCCPTAMRLVAFNTGEVACAAPASRTSTTSKRR
jgi:hypothetical protein